MIHFIFSVNDSASQADIYESLPNLFNFSTNFSVYVWSPVNYDEFDIPKHAIKIADGRFLARGYKDDEIELLSVIKNTQVIDLDYQGIDVSL
jgi:hypothetical protein